MASYRTRPADSLGARLTDLAIGLAVGIPFAIMLWAATIWLLFR